MRRLGRRNEIWLVARRRQETRRREAPVELRAFAPLDPPLTPPRKGTGQARSKFGSPPVEVLGVGSRCRLAFRPRKKPRCQPPTLGSIRRQSRKSARVSA